MEKQGGMNVKVFLGGTCNGSTWRQKLIPMLKIDYFDPVVDDWNEEAQKRELEERANCDYCLYVITPKMTGAYSIAEVIDDSNKRPHKTIFCFLERDGDEDGDGTLCFKDGPIRSLKAVGEMVRRNGGSWFNTLEEVANFLEHTGYTVDGLLVSREELEYLASFRCEHHRGLNDEKTCFDNLEQGGCCNSCWARRMLELITKMENK